MPDRIILEYLYGIKIHTGPVQRCKPFALVLLHVYFGLLLEFAMPSNKLQYFYTYRLEAHRVCSLIYSKLPGSSWKKIS